MYCEVVYKLNPYNQNKKGYIYTCSIPLSPGNLVSVTSKGNAKTGIVLKLYDSAPQWFQNLGLNPVQVNGLHMPLFSDSELYDLLRDVLAWCKVGNMERAEYVEFVNGMMSCIDVTRNDNVFSTIIGQMIPELLRAVSDPNVSAMEIGKIRYSANKLLREWQQKKQYGNHIPEFILRMNASLDMHTRIKNGEEVQCPKCNNGVIYPTYGTLETAHHYRCTNPECSFVIHEHVRYADQDH